MARDDGLDVHVEIGGRAHAPVDGHDGGGVGRRVLHDPGHHDVAGSDAQALGALVLGNDEEVVAQAVIQGHDGAERAGELEAAEQRVVRARDDGVDDGALLAARGAAPVSVGAGAASPAAAAPRADEEHADLVAAHGLADARARDLEGALGGLDHSRAWAQDAQRSRDRAALLARPLCGPAAIVALVRSLTRHVLLSVLRPAPEKSRAPAASLKPRDSSLTPIAEAKC